MSDETLDTTAPDEGQPVTEAVADETPVDAEPVPGETAAEASPEEQPSPATRAWAGKYQSPEELERAYLESQREASRMAGELSAFKKSPAPTTSAEPKWKQLEVERNKWAQHYRSTSLSEDQKWQADEQVRLYDREIAYERAKYDFEQSTTRTMATREIETEAATVMNQYANELNNMASPLYQASAKRYESLIRAGYPDNDTTKALAVTYAAALTKTNVSKAVQQDRGALLKTLNTQAKKAVVAGAGGQANVKSGGITGKDIDKMTAKEFADYERKVLGV